MMLIAVILNQQIDRCEMQRQGIFMHQVNESHLGIHKLEEHRLQDH